jgi:cell division protease FtsH
VWRSPLWIALVLFWTVLLFRSILSPTAEELDLSRLSALIEQGRVVDASVSEGAVDGTYREDGATVEFHTVLPPTYDITALVEDLEAGGAAVRGRQPSPWVGLLSWILPFIFIIGIYLLVVRGIRRSGASALSFGKSKAKLFDRTDLKTTFADVAGVQEVETELRELVEYLKKPEKFRRIGARIPKGVLLVGPPGTGKTLLARAVAGEADVPFFYISASEFIELFVGLGAARVRDLFEQARKQAPAIVFIDEIDAVGQSRAVPATQVGAHAEQEQTLQQLLSEMDGFEPNSGVIIMAASNRPEILDPALLRPGRFDRHIVVNLPDIKGREDILGIHSRGVTLAQDVDLEVLARRTPGFSGAQLANVINEGALLAARKSKDAVGMAELEEAVNRVVAGLERRSQMLSEEDRRMVAFHELGHAVVAWFVEHADPVHRVSIIPRGIGALGFTEQLPEEERYLFSEPELRDRIAVLFGGRAAEEVVFGVATTGGHDDLKKATEMARRMVMEFGMSKEIGPVNIAEPGPRFLPAALVRGADISDETAHAIDMEVKALLMEAHRRAKAILIEHRAQLDVLAHELLDKETLERDAVAAVLGAPDGAPVSTARVVYPAIAGGGSR